jgi:hypothetical protein
VTVSCASCSVRATTASSCEPRPRRCMTLCTVLCLCLSRVGLVPLCPSIYIDHGSGGGGQGGTAVPEHGVSVVCACAGAGSARQRVQGRLCLPPGASPLPAHPGPLLLADRRTPTQALASLQRYPLPLPTAKACLDLEGIGAFLVEQLERHLTAFLATHGPRWEDAEAAAGACVHAQACSVCVRMCVQVPRLCACASVCVYAPFACTSTQAR